MKKLVIMITMVFIFSFIYAEEVNEKVEKETAVKSEEVKENAETAQKELKKEVDPEDTEDKAEEAKEKTEEAKEKAEEAKEKAEEEQEESHRTFKAQTPKKDTQPVYLEEYKPRKEKTKEWHFIPIEIGVGTSLQVGLTIAQLTHKNFEIKIGRMMLGPGFTFGSKVDGSDRDKFVPGLTFLGEVSVGKFFGNPLKESCFGIMIGIGSKIIFDIRNFDDDDRWDDGIYFDDPLYVDFLPLYLTYRYRKGEKFYDFSLRIPLVWQNGVYVVTDETKLYNGVPDITLNFSFVF
jgi:hypothetical protein